MLSRPDRRDAAGGRPAPLRHARAFTLVELIVVVMVIGLVLLVALPGLGSMTEDARQNAAAQLINGVLTRAYVEATADANMTAVRFVPSQWDSNSGVDPAASVGRQHVVSYRYVTNWQDPADPSRVRFEERFERRPDTPSVVLPADVWAAPVESLSSADSDGNGRSDGEEILTGQIGQFRPRPKQAGKVFLQADDFLIVFSPGIGVVGPGTPAAPARFRLLAYNDDPRDRQGYYRREDPGVERFNYSGIVLYERETFTALGDSPPDSIGKVRQDLLKRIGRPYYVHRYGGGLLPGTPR